MSVEGSGQEYPQRAVGGKNTPDHQTSGPSITIGLMGGTFDPIHYGHLILAEQALEQFGLEKVLFVVAGSPPHKTDQEVTDASHRYKMTCLAVEYNEGFEVSSIEMDRQGPSYTIDTVKQILDMYGASTRVHLLLGADEARDLMTWRDPYGIAELVTIVVANRPGLSVMESLEALPADFAKAVVPMTMPGVDISSTDLRERVSAGRSVRYLVPDAVEEYISGNGLYRGTR